MTKKAKTEPEKPAGEMVTYDEAWAARTADVGMAGVDPADIDPPQILLVQRMSKVENMLTSDGQQAVVGKFYHTGTQEVLDQINCHFLTAVKKSYVDRRKENEPTLFKYVVVGVETESGRLFGMEFKGMAYYRLKPLFTAAVSQNKPMFVFRLMITPLYQEGEKGPYYVPAITIFKPETEPAILGDLEFKARRLERERPAENPDDEAAAEFTDPGTEIVNPDEIPL